MCLSGPGFESRKPLIITILTSRFFFMPWLSCSGSCTRQRCFTTTSCWVRCAERKSTRTRGTSVTTAPVRVPAALRSACSRRRARWRTSSCPSGFLLKRQRFETHSNSCTVFSYPQGFEFKSQRLGLFSSSFFPIIGWSAMASTL